MRKRLTILISVALVVALALFVRHARTEAEFTKTISYVHFVRACLEHYVKEEGEFPESLEILVAEGYMDEELMSHFFPSTETLYRKPHDRADTDFVVLEVRYKGRSIQVTKDFIRQTSR